jgi:hypothetical protein
MLRGTLMPTNTETHLGIDFERESVIDIILYSSTHAPIS